MTSDAHTMALFAGMAPTTTNAELMTNLCHLGKGTEDERSHSTNNSSVNGANLSCDEQGVDDTLLQETIHLAMGLPPNTETTRGLSLFGNSSDRSRDGRDDQPYYPRERSQCQSSNMIPCGDDDDDDNLRQMIHLAMGLPPKTRVTTHLFSQEDTSLSSSESATHGIPSMPSSSTMLVAAMKVRRRVEAAMQTFSRFLFPVSSRSDATPTSNSSKESIAARRRQRAERAKAPNGIPEELLGY